MRSALALVLVLSACNTPSKVAATATSTSGHATDCNGAALTLGDDAVVGSLDGKPITMKDLGPEAKNAERHALNEYCDAVFAARASALDNYVTEQLVAKAAKAAGKSTDDWMQEEVQKRIPHPSDQEIQAFYDARKRPGAPSLDEVKGQVVMVMEREKSEDAVRAILDELKKGINVEKKLPDVRSPPRDIEVTAHTAVKGPSTAKVKIVEFADFQCPYCSKAADAVRQLNQKYGDKVELVYRNFPLRSIHPFAQKAAEYGECAFAQGKFWEMADKMYADQDKLDEDSLKASALSVGLDAKKLDDCITSGKGAADVEDDFKKANDLGVEGTPTFFVNGRQHTGAPTLEGLSAAIDPLL